jgi:23S rRNA (adenine2030-N6)-methyltransferase
VNYRHAYHAGNFADVAKHIALVAALTHLKKKDKPFAVLDTHAGRGLYDLGGTEAARTGEAQTGIASLLRAPRSGSPLLETYLGVVREAGDGRYAGSPLIAAKMLRAGDRLVAIEKHPEDFAALKTVLAPYRRAQALQADGYERLAALLPPPERRGLVLIDPPYEAPDEFETAARALGNAYRRFATGIYLLWFPIKSRSAAESFCGEALAGGIARALRIDVAVTGEGDRLSAVGLLVVNPPFGFAAEMKAALEAACPHLGGGASFSIARLAGEE